jgi:amino acid permease
MMLQIYVKEKLGQNYDNLPDMTFKLFGRIGKNYVDFMFTIGLFTTCITYLIFIGK